MSNESEIVLISCNIRPSETEATPTQAKTTLAKRHENYSIMSEEEIVSARFKLSSCCSDKRSPKMQPKAKTTAHTGKKHKPGTTVAAV